jgi:hypothetical protein
MKKSRVLAFVATAVAALGLAALTTTSALAGQPDQAAPSRQAAAGDGGIIATFDVVGETFRVRFTDPASIKRAQELLANKGKKTDEPIPHPHGRIAKGTDVNTGYTWHLEQPKWSEMSMEVCDGRPSDVERGAVTSEYYCPWGAELIALEAAN